MKKRNKKASTTEKIVLATAILDLIFKLIELIEKLTEQGKGEQSPFEKYTISFLICQYKF